MPKYKNRPHSMEVSYFISKHLSDKRKYVTSHERNVTYFPKSISVL